MISQVSSTIILINYEINKEYISKNLCENRDKPEMDCCGKCVVKKDLEKDNAANKATISKEKETAKIITSQPAVCAAYADLHYSFVLSYILFLPSPEESTLTPPPWLG